MHEINPQSAADYLRTSGHIASDEPVEVVELSGGVSNLVLLVELPSRGGRFVLKQARGQLRVKEEWLCPVERIWREAEVLQVCGELLRQLSPSSTQIQFSAADLLWEDRDNYAYGMTAAPATHTTWKEELLAGKTEISLATSCGRLLGQLHARSWGDAIIADRLEDRSYFDQLRVDPYYRHIAHVHPDVALAILRLIDSVWQHRLCLVHGDFSPKNLLVWPGHVMLIDFEVGHFGDPAFDLGFFLTHLALKSIWAGTRRNEYLAAATEFWRTYRTTIGKTIKAADLASLEARMVLNLAGCMLARVDGKSPVDYLSDLQRSKVRELSREWIVQPPASWDHVATLLSKR